jgi:hypothetical protein
MTYDEKQFEVVRTILDEAQRHYEQATFELPSRRTTKASIWIAIYAVLVPAIPSYVAAILQAQVFLWSHTLYPWWGVLCIGFVATLYYFARGFWHTYRALSFREFEWLESNHYLEEVELAANPDKRMLFYLTLAIDLSNLTTRNLKKANEIGRELTASLWA